MPFLVATDLDGTLLRRDFTVSERTRAALVSAAAAGVEVVYATGRPPRWLAAVYETTGYRPITVCANGALTLHGDQALHVEAIPEEVAEEVREVLLQQRTDFVFRSETWRGHTLKLLAVLPDVDQQHADTVLQQVRAAAGHLVEPTHSTHSQLLIEMGPGGVTKANAVQRLREQRWPEHTMIAIGDMPNDESLLQCADIPMTVASGHRWLQRIADRVLPGPDDDGVAQLLEELAARGSL